MLVSLKFMLQLLIRQLRSAGIITDEVLWLEQFQGFFKLTELPIIESDYIKLFGLADVIKSEKYGFN